MTCQTCGGEATTRPALCDDCKAERQAHGRVKGRTRWEALRERVQAAQDRPQRCGVCGHIFHAIWCSRRAA